MIKTILTNSTLIITAMLAVLLFAAGDTASALSIFDGVEAAQGTDVPTTLFGNAGIITTITNLLLFIVGALAVIMLIIGGLRYTISGGNTANVTAAKNTILYAIIGLVIAFLAYAIVNWVIAAISPGDAGFSNV